jgi:hypothetical protein
MFMSIAGVALALQMGPPASIPPESEPLIQTVQYHRVPAHPPPCGHGWDLSARDGLCYPNGYLPPQDQAARQYQYQQRYYRGGRYPVPCGHGTDLDSRDGQCYPTGTVPPQFQEGRRYGGGGYYEGRRRYYYQD